MCAPLFNARRAKTRRDHGGRARRPPCYTGRRDAITPPAKTARRARPPPHPRGRTCAPPPKGHARPTAYRLTDMHLAEAIERGRQGVGGLGEEAPSQRASPHLLRRTHAATTAPPLCVGCGEERRISARLPVVRCAPSLLLDIGTVFRLCPQAYDSPENNDPRWGAVQYDC